MKKKLMIIAVLLGALSLGACVDDNESQSVTNVRNSKTAELKSIAAMEKAAAEAKVTMANAEAKLKAAEVAAQQAAAAKALAEAELEKKQAELIALQKEAAEIENEAAKIENEKLQAALEAEMAQLEVDKKLAEEKLAKVAAEMERMEQENQATLLETQLAMKKAEQELLDAQKQLDNATTQAEKDKIEAERQKLQERATAYSDAVDNLITAQNSLISMKTRLATLENGLTTLKEAKDAQIAENNNNIALYKMYIEKYQKYTNYTEDVTALRNEYNTLSGERSKLADAYYAKSYALNEVKVDLNTVDAADEAIEADDFYRFVTTRGTVYLKNEEGDETSFNVGFYSYMPRSYKYFTSKRYTYKIDEDNEFVQSYGDSIYIKFGELFTDIRTVELYVNNQIEGNESSLDFYKKQLEYNQAQYNGKATTVIGYDKDGKEILKPIRNAVDSTAYLKTKLDAAKEQADIDEYTRLYRNSINDEERLSNNITVYKERVEIYTMQIQALKKGWDMYQKYDANIAELQKKMDARNEAGVKAYEAKVAAWKVERDAYVAYQKVNTDYQAVCALLFNTWVDLNGDNVRDDNEILMGANAVNAQIESYQTKIEALEKDNADLSKIQTQEAAIANLNAKIAAKEVVVKAREVAVAAAKAALDEVMPKEEE